ncbi:unnamed protein product [Closterium sp. NIES-54]
MQCARLFLHPPDLRTAATHLQQAQLLFEKGTEARQNAAADLAASIGPVAAAGKRLAVAASSSSSAAAAGAAAAGRRPGVWRCLVLLVMAGRKNEWQRVEVTEFLVEHEFDLALEVMSLMRLWHGKVLFNVACRRLRLAFQIATGHFQPQGGQGVVAATPSSSSSSSSSTATGGSNSSGVGYGPVYPLQSRINDVIFIMHEARNAPKVRELCREWLAARGVVIDNVVPHSQPH